MEMETPPPTAIADLIKRFDEEVFYCDDKASVEYAYALAVRLRTEGHTDEARKYAYEALRLVQRLPDSIDGATCNRISLGGVPMPELLHDGVIRSRLGDLLAA
jgi:hypothetical protein